MGAKKLPVYYATIDLSYDGIDFLSLVDCPAVEVNWFSYSESEDTPLTFKVEDESERIIYGCVMRADYPIYRNQYPLGEFYVKYSKETIRQMAQKWIKDGKANNINLMHLENSGVGGVEMQEVFIKDIDNGINPKGFEEVSDGSLFAKYKVNNDAVWEEVKKGTFKGFSLEGYFGLEKTNITMNRIKEIFRKILSKFAQVKTTDGLVINSTLEVGDDAIDEEFNPIADGVYTLEDGRKVEIEDGKVKSVADAEEEKKEDEEETPLANEEETKPVEDEAVEEKEDVEGLKAENEELKKQVEELTAANEELTAKVEELQAIVNSPVVDPVEEVFEKKSETKFDSKLKKMVDRFSAISK